MAFSSLHDPCTYLRVPQNINQRPTVSNSLEKMVQQFTELGVSLPLLLPRHKRQIPGLFPSALPEVTMSSQTAAHVSVEGRAWVPQVTQSWGGSLAYKVRAEGNHYLWNPEVVLKDSACFLICAKGPPCLLQYGIPSVSSWKDKSQSIQRGRF